MEPNFFSFKHNEGSALTGWRAAFRQFSMALDWILLDSMIKKKKIIVNYRFPTISPELSHYLRIEEFIADEEILLLTNLLSLHDLILIILII